MFFHHKQQRIPWVWVITVIVLTIGMVLLLQNREARARDLRRLADLKQMQTMLHYHHELYGAYPTVDEFTCFSDVEGLFEALVPWLVTLPEDPSEGVQADDPRDACYNFLSNGDAYKIRASLEKNDFSMNQDGGVSDEWFEIYTTGARDW